MKKLISNIIGVPAAIIAVLVCVILYIGYGIVLVLQNLRDFFTQFFTGRCKSASVPKKKSFNK